MIVNEFEEKIKHLERELRYLKTAHIKTATTINTMSANISTNFTLYMPDEYTILSNKRAIITLTTGDGTDMISACYIVGINPDNYNQRYPFLRRIDSTTGQVRYELVVVSQNPDDYTTLSGGGTVNLSYTVQAVGSSQFSATVEYNDIFGGS